MSKSPSLQISIPVPQTNQKVKTGLETGKSTREEGNIATGRKDPEKKEEAPLFSQIIPEPQDIKVNKESLWRIGRQKTPHTGSGGIRKEEREQWLV